MIFSTKQLHLLILCTFSGFGEMRLNRLVLQTDVTVSGHTVGHPVPPSMDIKHTFCELLTRRT